MAQNSQTCNRCAAAGFPGVKIGFKKTGEDPATGKARWQLLNEDGSEHQHRSGPGDSSPEGLKEIAAAIRELAAAIRERKTQ